VPAADDRADAGPVEADRAQLHTFLTAQRQHVFGILEGLSDEELSRPVLPSGWSCLGLVRHLALDDEHYWFRCIIGGESLDFFGPEGEQPEAWQVPPDESAESIFTLYRDEIARADKIIAATPLDQPPAQRDGWWGDWDVPDLRYVLLHVLAETACHAGHLDAARELLDGRQWVVV
jgi:Protein of unknown function (DUF664)